MVINTDQLKTDASAMIIDLSEIMTYEGKDYTVTIDVDSEGQTLGDVGLIHARSLIVIALADDFYSAPKVNRRVRIINRDMRIDRVLTSQDGATYEIELIDVVG